MKTKLTLLSTRGFQERPDSRSAWLHLGYPSTFGADGYCGDYPGRSSSTPPGGSEHY